MANEKGSGIDGLISKAEDALGKFVDDAEKVDQVKTKAEGFLGKFMEPQQAEQVTDRAEVLLKKLAHGSSEEDADT